MREFSCFIRFLTVVKWDICDIADYEKISIFTEFSVDDCKFIHDNFINLFEKYKDTKEVKYLSECIRW